MYGIKGDTNNSTSNITNNNSDSESDNDVGEKSLIRSCVTVIQGSVIHFGKIISCAMVEGKKHYCIEYDDRSIEEIDVMELSRLQELFIKEINNDTVGQQKQKTQSTPDNEYVSTWVSFMCEGVAFYGMVKRCFLSGRRAKTWYVLYDGKDEKDILCPKMLIQRRHYARHGLYDPTLPAIPPPPSSLSTSKKDNTRRTTTQQQPATAKKKKVPQTKRKNKTVAKRRVIKKKSVKNKTKKKKDTTIVPKPKQHNADEETVATYGTYSPKLPYLYKVQYKDRSYPKYTPFLLEDKFQPKFQLPPGVNPTVAAMCNLSLPDSIIDGIVLRSNNYALARTKVKQYELVDGAFKKNPC